LVRSLVASVLERVTSALLLEVSALFMHRLLPAPLALLSLVTLQAAGAALWAPPAAAQNPYDAELRSLSRQARTQGREARGVMPLLEMMGSWDDATPARTQALLEALARDRTLSPARRAYVSYLVARGQLRLGRVDASERTIRDAGFVTDWQVVGPFDNEGRAGFTTEQPPEAERMAPFDASARYRGREREVGWRAYPNASEAGYVNFDAVFRPYQNTCGYAATTVHADRARAVSLNFGAGGAIKVYWNGAEVYADPVTREPYPERSAVTVGAHAGANRLLVKVCITEQSWGFLMRLGDEEGGVTTGLRADASELPVVTAGHAPGVTLPTLQGPLEVLMGALPERGTTESNAALSEDEREARARALFDAAQYLAASNSDDPAEHTARQLAARAAELAPTVARLRLAAELTDQRGEAMRFTARAAELFPTDPESLLLQAVVRRTGLTPEEALPLLDRLDATRARGVVPTESKMLRAAILLHLDMAESARELLLSMSRSLRGSPSYESDLAALATATARQDEVVARQRAAVQLRYDDVGARRELIADALRRDERAEVLAQLDVVRTLTDDSGAGLQYVAAVHESLGDTDAAIEALIAARELCPDDAEAVVAHGRLLLRQNQRDAAASTLREALALRPQDAATRDLIEQIEPEERADEAYAVPAETLLARRGPAGGYPLTMLEELTVNTVYENGLGSSFTQVAAQLHTRDGADDFREYGIQYDPSSQRVDVRLARVYRANGEVLEATRLYQQALGEPWYRIYYDTRALVVVFPTLEPGDVVELRYRVDDVAHRNLFADYYGDMHFLQGGAPTRRVDYVLRTPTTREFYFNEPVMPSLQHTRTIDGDVRVDHFFAENVAPLYSEPMMPGATEVRPYLHVSTYRTWEDVGTWYWGLIQDQLTPDDELRRTVRELVAGAPDLETKVRRIHDWVIDNTRYVGLEFGIHGFKPYRVTQIVRRGFGDCKDKASLLYAMFREAGIDAHIVLVRTRRNGDIRDLPASLSVFDHAIAYVPGLNAYIDGTAEYSGVHELPQMDQGVTVLHVWPEGASLRHTPVHPAAQNEHRRTLNVRLAADASATLSAEETVRGVEAASYRARYRAEGTRQERVERQLRDLFPGLELSSHQFDDLTDVEQPVRFTYAGDAPQFALRDGDSMRLMPSALGSLSRALARTQSRRHTLDLGSTTRYVERRVITLPPGARATTLPAPGEVQSPFGVARMRVTHAGGVVTIESEFELTRDRVPADEYAAFRAWMERADQLFEQRLLVEGGTP
jgi:tetratricopeptide (TPR) repeat protein